MHISVSGRGIGMSRCTFPYDFVSEIGSPKHFVQHNLRIRADVVVQMNIHASGICQCFAQSDCRFIEPLQIRVEAPAPVSRYAFRSIMLGSMVKMRPADPPSSLGTEVASEKSA